MNDSAHDTPPEPSGSPAARQDTRPGHRATVRDIANSLGIHFTTVAKALRGSPGVKPATREKIRQLAEQMGYKPDPLVSALSHYKALKKRPDTPFNGTLYWINAFDKQKWQASEKHFHGDCYRGAKQRSEELGFNLDFIWLSDHGLDTRELTTILKSRNASGVILGPAPYGTDEIDLLWDGFSTVRIGYSLQHSELSCVTTDQFENTRALYKKLLEAGLTRIGFSCTRLFDQRSRNRWSGSYLAMRQLHHPEIAIRPFLDPNPETSPASFINWYNTERPQAIIAGDGLRYLKVLRSAGVAVPGDVQLVSLHSECARGEMAGIAQNGEKVGRIAVEHLAGLIHRFQRGLETDPRTIMVQGEWIDGQTFDPALAKPAMRAVPISSAT